MAMKDITTENKAAQVGPGGRVGTCGAVRSVWRPTALILANSTEPCPASTTCSCPWHPPAALAARPRHVAADLPSWLPPHTHTRRSTTPACSWGWTPTGWRAGTCATRTALSARWAGTLARWQGVLPPGALAGRITCRLVRCGRPAARPGASCACWIKNGDPTVASTALCLQAASPIVNYAGGKDYARGTKFRCGLCKRVKTARPACRQV